MNVLKDFFQVGTGKEGLLYLVFSIVATLLLFMGASALILLGSLI